tara:strand:+ start:6071 stop:6511 length:441 start_codon:yes stop_codon:yes gene_type:complete
MASFRLLVLAFVRAYFFDHRVSPSQGEIRNALDTTRTRVRDALRSLEKDGLIIRIPGKRGLSLPSMRDEAIRQLRDLGFRVDEDIMRVSSPNCSTSGPNFTLLPPPTLDYRAPGLSLSRDGDQDGKPENDKEGPEERGREGTRRQA